MLGGWVGGVLGEVTQGPGAFQRPLGSLGRRGEGLRLGQRQWNARRKWTRADLNHADSVLPCACPRASPATFLCSTQCRIHAVEFLLSPQGPTLACHPPRGLPRSEP